MIVADGTDLGDTVDVNDIRIGNWIKEEGYISQAVNLQVTAEIIQYILDNEYIEDNDLYYPIKLTPEVLDKCGFIKKIQPYHYDIWYKEYIHVAVKSKVELTHLDDGMFGYIEGNLNVHFYYLHHLQNFWKDIARKELDIKFQI